MPAHDVTLPEDVVACLTGLGYPPVRACSLSGGVASDIWWIDTPSGQVCAKRALPRLRVAQNWEAPVERNAYEVAWMIEAAHHAPDAVPRILAHAPEAGLFVLPWYPPDDYPLWKSRLRDGVVEPDFAAGVGTALGCIHAGTAGKPAVAERFRTDKIFLSLRPDPYLRATGVRHPDIADKLEEILQTTMSTKQTLVHGDVSPKNILCGPDGPVFLDAECAWYGDSAFDLAFCLNHLVLKTVWRPVHWAAFLMCFDKLCEAYFSLVDWEPREVLESRAAALLPALTLARVDGKSPVEYIQTEVDRERVRRISRPLIERSPDRLDVVRQAWIREWREA